MQKVYVVFMWTDCRKENEAEILGVYLSKEKATRELRKFVDEHIGDDRYNIEEGKNFFNVISGDDYHVFEMQEMTVTED